MDTPPERYPQGYGARSLRVAHFRALRPSWPRSESRGIGTSKARFSLSGWVRSIPTPHSAPTNEYNRNYL
jgi:hypothetical protein